MASKHFADRFIASAQRLKSPLCVGLDPHLSLIPEQFGVCLEAPNSDRTAQGVFDFLRTVVDECADQVPAVKPQIAFFEQLGWRGLRVLEQLTQHARSLGLLVVLDAKRGDIGSTAEAYARSYLYPESPCCVDALTVNPYLGIDSLAPFLKAAAQGETGLFVLAKTSNGGSGEFQDLSVDGSRVFQRVARALRPHADALVGASGWSSIGIVAGATFPSDATDLRQILPNSLFLIPGFGAQGGKVQSAVASFVRGAAGLEGGLISSSRGILFGDAARNRGEDWQSAFRARLRSTNSQLSQVVQGAGENARGELQK